MADSLAAVVAGEWAVVGPPPGRPWRRRPRRRAQSGSGDEGVAGLVDRGGDVGAVDRAVGGGGDGAAGAVGGTVPRARSTVTDATPVTAAISSVTARWQCAQVMPLTWKVVEPMKVRGVPDSMGTP